MKHRPFWMLFFIFFTTSWHSTGGAQKSLYQPADPLTALKLQLASLTNQPKKQHPASPNIS